MPRPRTYYIETDFSQHAALFLRRATRRLDQSGLGNGRSTPYGDHRRERQPGRRWQPKVTFNLRYPGQYYDAESKLHYNHTRYFQPRTGRYLQPDLIGLEGGVNVYTYANGNPVHYTDPTGTTFWDVLDFGFFAESAVNFFNEPSWGNGFDMLGNGIGLLPGIPGIGSIKAGFNAVDGAWDAAKGLNKYDVGTYDSLIGRSVSGDGLDIHHAMQKHPAGQVVDGYDPFSGASIALPRGEHTQIPNLRGDYGGSARDLLARDIYNLRNYTNAPNSSLQYLIRLNKQMYPGAFGK